MCCDYPEKIKRSMYLVMIGTSTGGVRLLLGLLFFGAKGLG